MGTSPDGNSSDKGASHAILSLCMLVTIVPDLKTFKKLTDGDKLIITRCLDRVDDYYVRDQLGIRLCITEVEMFSALIIRWLPPMCLDIVCVAIHSCTKITLADVVFLYVLFGVRSPHTSHHSCDGSCGSVKYEEIAASCGFDVLDSEGLAVGVSHYRSVMSCLPGNELAQLAADALKEMKALAASGDRRTAAKSPAVRLKGLFVPEAEAHGISFLFGFRKPKLAVFYLENEGEVRPIVEIDDGDEPAPGDDIYAAHIDETDDVIAS